MQRYFWYTSCPVCRQGRLHIFEDLTHHRLYLHCDDCERGWLDPESARDPNACFLTYEVEFESRAPTAETIEAYGWSKYATNTYVE